MAKCKDCIHHFVCETLKGKTKDTWAETCVAYRHRETCVAVVRCKDCKWFNKAGYDNSSEDDMNLHMGFCLEWRRGTQACRFCSYGERKDNENP